MPTPFANVVFFVITALNTAGQLSAVDKAELPAGSSGPIQFSEGQCRMVIGKMANPEKFVCQRFESPGQLSGPIKTRLQQKQQKGLRQNLRRRHLRRSTGLTAEPLAALLTSRAALAGRWM